MVVTEAQENIENGTAGPDRADSTGRAVTGSASAQGLCRSRRRGGGRSSPGAVGS